MSDCFRWYFRRPRFASVRQEGTITELMHCNMTCVLMLRLTEVRHHMLGVASNTVEEA